MATPARPRPAVTPRASRKKKIGWTQVRMVLWIVGIVTILGWIFLAGRQSAGLVGVSQTPPLSPPAIPFIAPPPPPLPPNTFRRQFDADDAARTQDFYNEVLNGEVP